MTLQNTYSFKKNVDVFPPRTTSHYTKPNTHDVFNIYFSYFDLLIRK